MGSRSGRRPADQRRAQAGSRRPQHRHPAGRVVRRRSYLCGGSCGWYFSLYVVGCVNMIRRIGSRFRCSPRGAGFVTKGKAAQPGRQWRRRADLGPGIGHMHAAEGLKGQARGVRRDGRVQFGQQAPGDRRAEIRMTSIANAAVTQSGPARPLAASAPTVHSAYTAIATATPSSSGIAVHRRRQAVGLRCRRAADCGCDGLL